MPDRAAAVVVTNYGTAFAHPHELRVVPSLLREDAVVETWIVRHVSSACLAWLALTGVVYLITYSTRRRAEHGWLAAQALLATAYPLWLLGIAVDIDMMIAALALACTASVWFTRAHFQLPRPGSSWAALPVLGVVAAVLGWIGWMPAPALQGVLALVVAAAATHQIEVLWPLARSTTQLNARLLLGAWLVVAAAIPAAIVLGAVAAVAALTAVAFLYTVALARQHGLSLEESERQRRELEQRLATIELKSQEIAALNDELRRQIGLRSRQLASALATLDARSSGPAVGAEIAGRYRVLGRLGSGGMGVVYEVERRTDRRRFALKMLSGHAKPEVVARFAREAEILAQLHHPNLVAIIDVDIADGQLFIVMELVDGMPLDVGERDVAWRIRALAEIAAGLGAIHSAGIVHRDLKPANVLVAHDGSVKIADFGVSSFDSGGSGDVPTVDPLTATGMIVGTPGYIAPELVGGVRTATCAVDLFSFGVLAFELLAGTPPFPEGAVAMRLRGAEAAAVSLGELVPGLPVDLVELVHACIAWDPAVRPTAAVVLERLRALPAISPAVAAPRRARSSTGPTVAYGDAS